MRLSPLRFALVPLALAVAAPASAQSLQAAQSLYDQGKWQEAANAAAALNTSAGFALAAEATTAGASVSPDAQKKALFAKAQEYARQAIAKDANNADAYFELARAQGRLAQFVGILQSLNLAGDMKKNLEQALRLKPNMASAYVALGLWHANLVSKGGAATLLTGAKKNQIVPNFEKAIALEPNVAIHRIEYANALLLQGNKAGAIAQLQKAVSLPADTYWEKRDLEAAKAKLASLQ
ncbi:tetratricopeptide repeat protein [Deinococcus sp. YIM 77859]|uniref:tetratricopeptide repeat protein n=1 Tax=Deinococcus sp. YIM 77859 TaxID=1540221 RepID=UPI0005515988|nr:tetratricopeptide repeat protein [Deinococcus sp. YIM 77859]